MRVLSLYPKAQYPRRSFATGGGVMVEGPESQISDLRFSYSVRNL